METKAKALLKFGAQAMREMRMADAEAAFQQATDITRSGDPLLHSRAVAGLHTVLGFLGRAHEARPLVMNAMASAPQGSPAAILAESCLIEFVSEREPELPKLLRDLIAAATRPELARDIDVARALARLALRCNALGDADLAAQLLERAIPTVEAHLGAQNPELALMFYNLADLRGTMHGYGKVEPMMRRAIAIQEATLAQNHPERVAPLLTLGLFLQRTGRFPEARQLAQRAHEIALAFEGENGRTVGWARQLLQAVAEAQASAAETESALLGEVAAAEAKPSADPFEIGEKLTALCKFLFLSGDSGKAVPHYRKLRAIVDKLDELPRGVLASAMGVPFAVYGMMRSGKTDLAETFLKSMLEAMDAVLPVAHEERLSTTYFLGNFYRMVGRHEDALRTFSGQLGVLRSRDGGERAGYADVMGRMLDALLELGREQEAAQVAADIERLTGARPIMDPALNQIGRELVSIWAAMRVDPSQPLVEEALAGNAHAAFVVGLCHEMGLGVAPDLLAAHTWYLRASKAGNEAAAQQMMAAVGATEPAGLDMGLIGKACAAWLQSR